MWRSRDKWLLFVLLLDFLFLFLFFFFSFTPQVGFGFYPHSLSPTSPTSPSFCFHDTLQDSSVAPFKLLSLFPPSNSPSAHSLPPCGSLLKLLYSPTSLFHADTTHPWLGWGGSTFWTPERGLSTSVLTASKDVWKVHPLSLAVLIWFLS